MQGVGPGSVLGGRYAVTARTVEGAHHERWRASDNTLERDVVLVCFAVGSAVAAPALDAARRAAGVEDPRLVRVLDVGSDGAVGFIVEEPLTGATPLWQLLTSGGLPAEEVRRLVGESAGALDKARARGLHHLALTPDSVLRMPDGAVKVRGLATEAALLSSDAAVGEQASRLDAIGLVKLIYAGLTARWPAAVADPSPTDPAGVGPEQGLEAAPTMLGGVAAPSEIVVGVPNDLDLICRMTLSDDRGPTSPGDLAVQIAPWPAAPPTQDGASGIGLPAAGGMAGAGVVGAGVGAAASSVLRVAPGGGPGGGGGQATERGDGADPELSQPSEPDAAASPTPELPAAQSGPAPDEQTSPTRGGVAAAGAGVASVAGAISGRVGSFARAATDKAATKTAERRAAFARGVGPNDRTHGGRDDAAVEGYDEEVEDIDLDEALDAPPARLDPPLPVFGAEASEASEAPSKAASRVAIAIVAALVLVALVIGINNVMKIGTSDGAAAPQPVVTVTATRPTPAPSTTSAPSPSPTPSVSVPPEPVTITGGKGFDPQDDNSESDELVRYAYDGNPATKWRSRWYGTRTYLGKKDGVGIVLTLDRKVSVKEVDLVLPDGAKQDGTVYVNTKASLDGAQQVGQFANQAGTITLSAPDDLKEADKLIVWITKPAPDEAPNHYRAQISEVTVR